MPREDLTWLVTDLAERRAAITLRRDYYEGRHRLLFATEKFRNAFGALFREFADNLCMPVVDAYTDALQVQGFTTPDAEEAEDAEAVRPNPVAEAAQVLWDANKMGKRAGEVFRDAFATGDGYLIVWPSLANPNAVRMLPQEPDQIAVKYDPENPDEIALAGKLWKLPGGNRYRANLYYPDRIERWVTLTNHPNGVPKEARRWAEWTEDEDGPEIENAWGQVPIFHFGNNADTGKYGRSELTPVIPVQDALNKTISDMLVTGEFHAMPLRWATGVEVQRDPETGKELDPFKDKNRPGAWVWTATPDAQFGQLDPASLEGFLRVQEAFRLRVAGLSGLPPHDLGLSEGAPGADASGEAIKTREGRKVKKVNDRQRDFGEVLEAALLLGLRMAKAPAAGRLTVQWAPAESRAEKAFWETQEIKAGLGLSKRIILREGGYSDPEIAESLEEAEAVARDTAELAAMQQAAGLAGAPVVSLDARRGAVPAVQENGD